MLKIRNGIRNKFSGQLASDTPSPHLLPTNMQIVRIKQTKQKKKAKNIKPIECNSLKFQILVNVNVARQKLGIRERENHRISAKLKTAEPRTQNSKPEIISKYNMRIIVYYYGLNVNY